MPEKSTFSKSFDWFGVAKSAVLVFTGIAVLWLNSNYASVVDLQELDKKVSANEVKTQVLDQKVQSIVELINTKLEYIKRDTDEIKKKLETAK
jgi:ABC-type antimicrobial peptide transport system permease subunit